MKTLSTAIMALAMIFSTALMAQSGTEYTINTEKSVVKWFASKVTGKHNGDLKLSSGSVIAKGSELLAANFVADMTTINCEDLEGEYADKLVGHLKSDDFFSVEKYPTASFEMLSFKDLGEGNGEMIGKLTIKGHTENITVPVQLQAGGNKFAAKGNVTFDRTKFDIKYGSASVFKGIGDKAIHDDVKFSFAIVGSAK